MAGGALVEVAIIATLGIGGSWLASRLQWPAILVLLLAGFLAGPVTGLVHPDALLGDLLGPFVSLSVAVILFEGGLTLRTVELEGIGSAVLRLVTVGVLVTWGVVGTAAHYIVGLDWGLALLLGAILTVTGPTVIIPILRQIRPEGEVGKTLKWEGILIDPIGVVLAVLVFEALLAGGPQEATFAVVTTMGKALSAGVVFGTLGGFVAYEVIDRHLASDHLDTSVQLGLLVLVFTACEIVQVESGLVGATVMGIVLANRGDAAKRHIIEFKENLGTLLLSILFIVLAARIDASALEILSVPALVFLGVIILVGRPLCVYLSTVGTELSWRARGFLSAMAPRGIVAASIASVFAIELEAKGFAGADQIVQLAFLVIVATVAVYGIGAGPLARWLDVGDPDPQGVLIVGAHSWARDLAAHIAEADQDVIVMDTNTRNLEKARQRGLRVDHESSLTEHAVEEVDLAGIGHLLALTGNDEVNQLTVLNFQEAFDRSRTYQLAPAGVAEDRPRDLSGRLLFDEELTHARISNLLRDGWQITRDAIPPQADEEQLEERADLPGYDLVVVHADGETVPITPHANPDPEPGDWVIRLVPPDEE